MTTSPSTSTASACAAPRIATRTGRSTGGEPEAQRSDDGPMKFATAHPGGNRIGFLPMHVVTVSGSLRARSSNALMLDAAAVLFSPFVQVSRYEGIAALPAFNPDLDVDPPPPQVTSLRALFRAADGFVVSSPEYAHGIPGAFKNMLDWLVSSGELSKKPILLLNAAPSGAEFAHPALVEVLRVLEGRVLDDATVTARTARRAFDESGRLVDETLREQLLGALRALERAMA
jgi:NAD(P)H-dependent FMN reductase